DDETIRRADLYVVHAKDVARQDQSPDVWEVAQKGIKSWDSIAEVQDLVAGTIKGRTSPDQITVFNNNTGAGTQFAAVGAAVLKRAREMGLGREIPTEWILEDVSREPHTCQQSAIADPQPPLSLKNILIVDRGCGAH